MAVLVYSELNNLVLDRIQANVSTDAPVSATEMTRFLNDAYADVYSISGARIKRVASATAWTAANSATGTVVGILTDVEEVLHVYASTTSGSVGMSTGDYELDRVELSRIMWLRGAQGQPTYLKPKVYAIWNPSTATPASVNLLQLEYWPSVTGFYLPILYAAQFTPIDSVTVTTPDVNDLESRDIGLLAAARLAPLIGRPELVPSILADISNRTAELLSRKISALQYAKQDDSARVAG